MPLLLWWAIENKAVSDHDVLMEMLGDSTLWRAPIFRSTIASRLGQRYTADRSAENFSIAAKLLTLAPDNESTDALIRGMDEGLKGDALKITPTELQQRVAVIWRERVG